MSDPFDLSARSLLEGAATEAGLEDFGDPSFREGLDVLLKTYEACGLKPGGRKRTRRRQHQLLLTRLRVEQAWKDHPEILSRKIVRPLYLTGLPRTGTSTLFGLLAIDEASRPLLLWEGVCPDPLVDWPEGEPDPRCELIQAGLDIDRAKNSDFDKIHFASAAAPEECVLLLALTFRDVQMGIEPLMQPYGEWFVRQDFSGSYAYYANLLRMLDWQRPGRRWLLKSPAHLWAVDSLLVEFPDACVLQTHRNPLEIIGSYCSMMLALMSIRERVDPAALGPVVLEFLALSLERGLAARDAAAAGADGADGANGKDPVLDLDYHRFIADPVAEIRRIEAHFSLGLDDAAFARMQAHVDANPQNQHGAHRYSLEQYGLSADQVRDRLGFYIQRFDLPVS